MSRSRIAMRMASGQVKVINPYVHLDIEIEGVSAGRLIFELRADALPDTCENFRLLCRGQTFQGNNQRRLCIEGCSFTRISPGEVCQSGDLVQNSGADGESVFNSKYFNDEKFIFKHIGRGLLSMVNDGPNRNSSRFFITFNKMPMLDGKHVVFGFCCHGMETLDLIERCGENGSGKPLRQVRIAKCGELVNPAEYSMPFLKIHDGNPDRPVAADGSPKTVDVHTPEEAVRRRDRMHEPISSENEHTQEVQRLTNSNDTMDGQASLKKATLQKSP